jgi:DNA-binding transcriptional LysR family regulator
MDRFEAMSLLLAVTDAGSLSAASRRLGVPLATVSRKISALEAHLGARLLIRSSRNVALTEAGAAYVAASWKSLARPSAPLRANTASRRGIWSSPPLSCSAACMCCRSLRTS